MKVPKGEGLLVSFFPVGAEVPLWEEISVFLLTIDITYHGCPLNFF